MAGRPVGDAAGDDDFAVGLHGHGVGVGRAGEGGEDVAAGPEAAVHAAVGVVADHDEVAGGRADFEDLAVGLDSARPTKRLLLSNSGVCTSPPAPNDASRLPSALKLEGEVHASKAADRSRGDDLAVGLLHGTDEVNVRLRRQVRLDRAAASEGGVEGTGAGERPIFQALQPRPWSGRRYTRRAPPRVKQTLHPTPDAIRAHSRLPWFRSVVPATFCYTTSTFSAPGFSCRIGCAFPNSDLARSLVPKLCLGTHVREALLRVRSGSDAKRSFADRRSQAELGNEGEAAAPKSRGTPCRISSSSLTSPPAPDNRPAAVAGRAGSRPPPSAACRPAALPAPPPPFPRPP